MAIASASKENNGSSLDSFPSTSLASKPGSDTGSETSSVGISGAGDHSDRSDQPDSSVSQRKDFEIQSPASLKSEEYRLLFRLPPDEVLVQDFNCALQENFLLQGHLYLFVRHVCFYSNIFGFETKKTIPFHEFTCVRKAKTAAIFPNAIEIVVGDKKHFFASFLSRDEAYRLIVDGWAQHSNGANTLIDRQDSKSEIRSQANGDAMIENIKSFQEPANDLISADRNKDVNISGENRLLLGEDYISVSRNLPEEQENGEEYAEQALNAECLSSSEPLRWKLEDADAPKVPDCYTKVAESKFPIPVEEFFNHFFSDDAANFTETFHQRCGDKDFRCSSWYEHEQLGCARDLSFQHPIKIYFGAKLGHCQEVQKFRVYRNSHLVIETSQEVSDVPYADYFRVEGLWIVERDDNESNDCCILRVYVYVAFSKKTIWKGKIEQSTVEECREAYSLWLNNAYELLKQKNLTKLEGSAPASNTIQNDDVQLEGLEMTEQLSERLQDTRNLPGIPQVTSDYKDVNPPLQNLGQRDLRDATSTTALLRESLASFYLYLKSQKHFPLVLVIACVSIILLMQLSIIVLLTRAPQVHLISQMDYINGMGSNGEDRAEAVAWLERRVHHLKDDMLMVEARLEKMRQEYALLKSHLKGLEQLKKAR